MIRKSGSEDDRRLDRHVVPGGDPEGHDEREAEVDERHEDAREREDQQGEVHLLHERPFASTHPAVSVNTAAVNVHGTRFEHREHRIGEAGGREIGELPEDQREDDHRQERLQHGPRDADQ